ncbi:hypothetical protein BUALT_Bualt02G0157300 [Buddleja alternifolia]|uniref:AT-rich interactive domain-containing protein 2 n=1 Tax=Buddleja alternifolia TaxID=168488 RepID=A0AAV6Y0K6_9LAMI|nr:hypothetical protein BUALT_Bualt02G0157300 [Buddleja alternifolia]
MVQKRPFDEDDVNDVSFKQPRQLEHNKLCSTLEYPCEPVVWIPHASGETDNNSAEIKPECNEKLDIAYGELPFCPTKDVAVRAPASLPCSSRAANGTSEEDMMSESPFHILVTPDYNYNNSDRPPRTNVKPAEIYSYLLDNPPRKFVPVGPDFQARVPEWGVQCKQRTFSGQEHTYEAPNFPSHDPESVQIEKLCDQNEFVGTCIILMPDSEPPADSEGVGLGRTDCLCDDFGSIRCVRQHVLEERDKLKRTLGHEAFAELGFCGMGELVAERWSKEEEKLFHEVIFSNPPSLGKNFWDDLTVAFPSRTKKEIVSYYFNVFMLRRRAEQNRFDPLNIDSDNDEWHGTDDSADNEAEIDEDDDSVVQSPKKSDQKNCFGRNTNAYDKDLGSTNTNVLEKCKSDDAFVDFKVTTEKSDNYKQWVGHFSGHEFMLEAYNARDWDIGYRTLPRNEFDLLPTCSMIEEVFGAESWNYKARDGQELS